MNDTKMNNKILFLLSFVVFVFCMSLCIETKLSEGATGYIEGGSFLASAIKIGNPAKYQFPADNPNDCVARDIWDMHYYDSRIYVGYGDWMLNRGPIDVWWFRDDGETPYFEKEYRVDEEAIYQFRDYSGKLYIPGVDASGSSLGGVYIRENSQWRKSEFYATHILDVAIFQGDLYLTALRGIAMLLARSRDQGYTWEICFQFPDYQLGGMENMVPFPGFLLLLGWTTNWKPCVYRYDGSKLETLAIPYPPRGEYSIAKRVVRFKDGILYTTVYLDRPEFAPYPLLFLNDFQTGAITIEQFKEDNVRDVIVRGETCYVMTASIQVNGIMGYIYSSSDLKNWVQLAQFIVPAMPYSFELLNGDFYVGLGTRTDSYADAESGSIYRIENANVYVDVSNTTGVEDGSQANPFNTIQEGINVCQNGYTVIVADGIYTGPGNVNLVFGGKAITVKSKNGANNCIIDCAKINGTQGFYFCTGENSVVDGFTIRNGNSQIGGGILCVNSSPTIKNNIITGNTAGSGGGICCWANSSPEIIHNVIRENTAQYGAGIGCSSSAPKIMDNIIMGNSAQMGGGIGCTESQLMLADNYIMENTSVEAGGGIGLYTSTSTMTNCIIAGNSATEGAAGGIGAHSSTLTIVNCTIAGNSASEFGVGFACTNSPATITNTIIWQNVASNVYITQDSNVSISNSDIYGGRTGIEPPEANVNWLGGNINSDPLFVDVSSDNYHLSDQSPCIGRGIMTQDVPITDLDGNPRPAPAGSNPDIGAYESYLGGQGAPLSSREFQEIKVVSGWNQISFPSNKCFYQGDTPTDQPDGVKLVNITSLGFKTIAEWLNSIVRPEKPAGKPWQFIIGTQGVLANGLPDRFQTLKYISPCSGYLIKVSENAGSITIALDGSSYNSYCPILLSEGWNLVGCPLKVGYYDSALPPDVKSGVTWVKTPSPVAKYAFGSIAGKYRRIISLDGGYDPIHPYTSSLHYIKPGGAYWIEMNESSNLIYYENVNVCWNRIGLDEYPRAGLEPLPRVDRGPALIPTRPFMMTYGSISGTPSNIGTQVKVFSQKGVLCGQSTVMQDGYYGIMMVYGDDTDTPQVDGAMPGEQLTFYINGKPAYMEKAVYWLGDRSVQQANLVGDLTQELDLYPGWNLISICLDVDDNRLISVLSPIEGHWKAACTYDPGAGWIRHIYGSSDPTNELQNIVPGKGYLINTDKQDKLIIKGKPTNNLNISLKAGWNLIGYNFLVPLSIESKASSLPSNTCIYTYNSELVKWLGYAVGGTDFLNKLNQLEPGKGYWIRVEQDCIWTISP